MTLTEQYQLWLEEQEQLDEILNMMRDYHQAWKLHVRAEQKRNNPLAKHGVLGPTVAGIAAYASGPVGHHVAHAVHHLVNGNIEGAAVHAVAAGVMSGLAHHVIGGHLRETHKIFKKLRAQRKQNPVMTTESTHIDNHLEKAHEIVKHHGKEDEIEKMIEILKGMK